MFHCTIVDFHVLSPSYPRRVSKRGDKYYHFLFRYSAIVGDYLISRTHSNISWFARKLCQWIKQACPEGKNLKKVLNVYRNHSGNNFLAIFMIISAIVSAVASTRLILQACDDKVKIFRVLFTQINIWNFFSGKKKWQHLRRGLPFPIWPNFQGLLYYGMRGDTWNYCNF